MFRVFENGKRCSAYNIPSWNIDTFKTKEEAEVFAAMWAYPVSKEQAKEYIQKMELNVPVNMTMSEFPVMMEIRKVEE